MRIKSENKTSVPELRTHVRGPEVRNVRREMKAARNDVPERQSDGVSVTSAVDSTGSLSARTRQMGSLEVTEEER